MTTIGHPLRPEDPRRISDYELLGRLGGGGMGIVYAARAPGDGVVALKTVRALGDAGPDDLARFGREMQAASSIDSPHVAAVLGFRRDLSPPFLVTEFVDGLDVRENVEEHGPLDEDACVALALGTARGLAALHARDIAHRDLTWTNVVLTAAGPVIVDLGIALRRDETRLTSTGRIGSPAWMPPEAWSVGDAADGDPRAGDVFQWGLLVAHAATGRHPFDVPGARHADLQLAIAVDGARDLRGVPPRLRDLVDRSLAHAPGDRPTAPGLVEVLDEQARDADRTRAVDQDRMRSVARSPVPPPSSLPVGPDATRVLPPPPPPPDAAARTVALPPPAGSTAAESADDEPPWEVVEFEIGPDGPA